MTSPKKKFQNPVWCREDSVKLVVFTNKNPMKKNLRGEGSVDLTGLVVYL